MTMDSVNGELKFPVVWHYHIIAEADNMDCEEELKTVLAGFDKSVRMEPGMTSKGGKYQGYRASVKFNSRQDMDELSAKLAGVSGVKFLL